MSSSKTSALWLTGLLVGCAVIASKTFQQPSLHDWPAPGAAEWIELRSDAARPGEEDFKFLVERAAEDLRFRSELGVLPTSGTPHYANAWGGGLEDGAKLVHLTKTSAADVPSHERWGVIRYKWAGVSGERSLSRAEWDSLRGTSPEEVLFGLRDSYQRIVFH